MNEASAMEMGEGEWVMVNRVRNFGDGNEASEMRKKMEKLRNREGRERKDRAECVDEREVSGGKHNKFFFFFLQYMLQCNSMFRIAL